MTTRRNVRNRDFVGVLVVRAETRLLVSPPVGTLSPGWRLVIFRRAGHSNLANVLPHKYLRQTPDIDLRQKPENQVDG